MRNKERLTPYPILDNYKDDYITSSFLVEYEVNMQFDEIVGILYFSLNNPEIEELVKAEKAVYSVHLESSAACYREIIKSKEPEIQFKVNSKNVAKVLEIRTFITLTEDITDFTSAAFHPDYANQKFNLNKNQIIAVGTAKNYDLKRDDKELDSLPSVFQIRKTNNKKKGTLTVDTDNDNRILIGLDSDTYELYSLMGKSLFKKTAFSIVLLPVLIIVLQRMHSGRDDEDMTSRHWYKVIEGKLEANGISITDIDIENDSLLNTCQQMFADPIANAFKELQSCSERMNY